jgi:formate hydrogenlyase subunit 3/multisubunit Na+/H+ antiporter MnhD subunit
MFLLLLILLLILFGLALLSFVGHIILWVFLAGVLVGGYELLNQTDYKHLLAVGFVLIALKLVIDALRKKDR